MSPSDSSSDAAAPLKVTFVSWQALSAVFPSAGRNVGGLELAAWKLSRALAQQHDVQTQLIVRSNWRGGVRRVDGVDVTLVPQRREFVRRSVSQCVDFSDGIRIRQFRPKLLWQIPYLAVTCPWRSIDPPALEPDPRLQGIDADVWVAFGASRESAGVIATAKQQGKPSLLMLQSNNDVDADYLQHPERRNAYGELGLHCMDAVSKATVVACQTTWQQDQLSKHFGREGVLIPNSTDPIPWREASRSGGDYVLWIGRYDRFHKRVHLAIEIAKLLPEISFRMIVNASDETVRQDVQASCPENIRLVDYVPFDEMPGEFGCARVFLSTGSADYEGFPAVLLHAIAAGKPIVSLDDFSGFIAASGGGTVTGEVISEAAEAVRQYWDHSELYDPTFATEYLNQYHSIEAVGRSLAAVLRESTKNGTTLSHEN